MNLLNVDLGFHEHFGREIAFDTIYRAEIDSDPKYSNPNYKNRKDMAIHKTTWRLLGTALIIGLLFVLLPLSDEELRPEVKAVIERGEQMPPEEENGYFVFIAGLDVAFGEDPWTIGRTLAEQYGAAIAKQVPAKAADFNPYPDQNRLPRSETLSSLCQIEQGSCIKIYRNDTDSIRQLIAEHAVLLQRYRSLYKYKYFVAANTHSFSAPLPRFRGLLDAHQLLIADLIVRFATGDQKQAVTELIADIQFQRRLLGQADNLLIKMTAVSSLTRDVHLVSQLLDAKGSHAVLDPLILHELKPLTASERSLRRALESEVAALYQFMKYEFKSEDLSEISSALSTESGQITKGSKMVMSIALKPNATANDAYETLVVEQLGLERLRGPDLVRRWSARQNTLSSGTTSSNWLSTFFSWPFNPLGNTLQAIAHPRVEHQFARICDLDGLLLLVKLKRRLREQGVEEGQVQGFLDDQSKAFSDSYTNSAMHYNSERKTIGFEGLSVTGEDDRWRTEITIF